VVGLIGAVSQAGVLDLIEAAESGLGGSAVADLMRSEPADEPERYQTASPIEQLPLGRPVTLVHGTGDSIVPTDQSERYAEAAETAGDEVEFVRLDGVDHMALIDPSSAAWETCRTETLRLLGR